MKTKLRVLSLVSLMVLTACAGGEPKTGTDDEIVANSNDVSDAVIKGDHIIISGRADAVVGDGKVSDSVREASAVARVVNDSPLPVQVRVGVPSITVSIDANLQSLVSTSVVGDTLTISLTKGIKTTLNGPAVLISMPSLRRAEAINAGSLDVKIDDASAPFAVQASGAGNVTLDGASTALTADASSNGDISLSGTTDHVDLACSGNGGIDAASLDARTGTIRNSHNGSVDASISGSVDVANSGNGSVNVSGGATPGVVTNSVRGKVTIE